MEHNICCNLSDYHCLKSDSDFDVVTDLYKFDCSCGITNYLIDLGDFYYIINSIESDYHLAKSN